MRRLNYERECDEFDNAVCDGNADKCSRASCNAYICEKHRDARGLCFDCIERERNEYFKVPIARCLRCDSIVDESKAQNCANCRRSCCPECGAIPTMDFGVLACSSVCCATFDAKYRLQMMEHAA